MSTSREQRIAEVANRITNTTWNELRNVSPCFLNAPGALKHLTALYVKRAIETLVEKELAMFGRDHTVDYQWLINKQADEVAKLREEVDKLRKDNDFLRRGVNHAVKYQRETIGPLRIQLHFAELSNMALRSKLDKLEARERSRRKRGKV